MRPAHNELLGRAAVFGALSDPTRLSIVAKLSGGRSCSIAQITRDTRLTRQAVTKHLQVLERAGLVRGERLGRESRFSFNAEPIVDARKYLQHVSTQWDEALERLRLLLERNG